MKRKIRVLQYTEPFVGTIRLPEEGLHHATAANPRAGKLQSGDVCSADELYRAVEVKPRGGDPLTRDVALIGPFWYLLEKGKLEGVETPSLALDWITSLEAVPRSAPSKARDWILFVDN
jgi:hypothetical protein